MQNQLDVFRSELGRHSGVVESALFVVATPHDLRGELPCFGTIRRLVDGLLGRESGVLQLVNFQPLLGDSSRVLLGPMRIKAPRDNRTNEEQTQGHIARETQRPMFSPSIKERLPEIT